MTVGVKVGLSKEQRWDLAVSIQTSRAMTVGMSKEQRWDLAVSIQTSRAMTVDMKVGVRNKGGISLYQYK